jgi:hypothetical protein
MRVRIAVKSARAFQLRILRAPIIVEKSVSRRLAVDRGLRQKGTAKTTAKITAGASPSAKDDNQKATTKANTNANAGVLRSAQNDKRNGGLG